MAKYKENPPNYFVHVIARMHRYFEKKHGKPPTYLILGSCQRETLHAECQAVAPNKIGIIEEFHGMKIIESDETDCLFIGIIETWDSLKL